MGSGYHRIFRFPRNVGGVHRCDRLSMPSLTLVTDLGESLHLGR